VIGGPPVVQPYYPYQYAAPQPAYAQPPRPQPARATNPPVIRGQIPDETPRRSAAPKLEMPPPEALGVPVPAAPPDWIALRVRLDRLGATRFSLDRSADGYRFTCQVTGTDGKPRTLEGRAATESEAVQRALATAGR
jgi:hypothetical protein